MQRLEPLRVSGLSWGGKDPAYVMEDANLDAAVDALIDGGHV